MSGPSEPTDPVDPTDLPGVEQRCDEFVEQVTDYLEDALDPAVRTLLEQHLAICDGCTAVLAQWRETIRLTGRLGDDAVDEVEPATRDRLLGAFRRQHGA